MTYRVDPELRLLGRLQELDILVFRGSVYLSW